MTRLAFSGLCNGRMTRVVWQDGVLSGDPGTAAWIHYVAKLLEGRIIGPIGGPYTSSHHLADPYVAADLIRSIFPGKVTQEGLPPRREIPAGAIH